MITELRRKIATFIASDYIKSLEVSKKEEDERVDQRVAETLGKMDLLDVLLKDYYGTFSKQYERPEDKLDERSKISIEMWGYTQDKDPNFEYLTDWIMDRHANEMLRHAAVTPERILYGRAQIAATELLKIEVKRLSNAYLDRLDKNKIEKFDESISVD